MTRGRRRNLRAGLVLAAALASLAGPPALAEARPEEAGRVAYLGEVGGTWQVFVMDPDGSGRRQLTRSPGDKTRCSFYPDGRALLVSTSDGRQLRVDLASGAEAELALGAGEALDAALSPDGRTVALTAGPTQSRHGNEIFLVALDGSGRRKLTKMRGVQHEPSWSPDGSWIYFLAGEDGADDHDIFRVSPDGSRREQVTAGLGFHFDVAVAPDGTIAFSSNRSGSYELFVQEEGAPARPLTEGPAADGSPAWSPDGREILFESSRGGRSGLWRVARAGGGAEPVPTERPARRPVWWHPAPAPSR